MTSVFSWQNSISLCPASFRIPRLQPAHLAQVAVTGALSAAERSYPMSKVRGRSLEDPMP